MHPNSQKSLINENRIILWAQPLLSKLSSRGCFGSKLQDVELKTYQRFLLQQCSSFCQMHFLVLLASRWESKPDSLGESWVEVMCARADRYGWSGSVITHSLRRTQISWRLCRRVWKHITMPGRKIDSKLAVWLLVPIDVLMALCQYRVAQKVALGLTHHTSINATVQDEMKRISAKCSCFQQFSWWYFCYSYVNYYAILLLFSPFLLETTMHKHSETLFTTC